MKLKGLQEMRNGSCKNWKTEILCTLDTEKHMTMPTDISAIRLSEKMVLGINHSDLP